METGVRISLMRGLVPIVVFVLASCSSEPKQEGTNQTASQTAESSGEGAVLTAFKPGVPGGLLVGTYRETATVTGIDLTEPMLRQAVLNIRKRAQAGHIHVLLGRGEQLPFADNTFDALTFTYLLRYVADPGATIHEMARVVKSGGVIASLEFYVPPNRAWRALWLAYTRAVLPAAGLLTGGREWFKVGRFLGPSISEHYRRYPTSWHVEAWHTAGLGDVRVQVMSLGGGLVMTGRKATSESRG